MDAVAEDVGSVEVVEVKLRAELRAELKVVSDPDILICLQVTFLSVGCTQNMGRVHTFVQTLQNVPGKMFLSRSQRNNERSTNSVK